MSSNHISYANEDRCLYCNELIPEGRMICPCCESRLSNVKPKQNTPKKSLFQSFLKSLQC